MLRFEKYQGTGNDFVIFEMSELDGLQHSLLAQKVCNRRFGIGADGSIATMCGNGIRCFAKYATDHELVKTKVFTVETLAGILTLEIIESDDLTSLVRVNMGSAIYQHESVPLPGDGDKFINQMLEVDGVPYTVSSLFMGTIHTVLFMDNIDEEAAARIGAAIENHPLYPNKTNA